MRKVPRNSKLLIDVKPCAVFFTQSGEHLGLVRKVCGDISRKVKRHKISDDLVRLDIHGESYPFRDNWTGKRNVTVFIGRHSARLSRNTHRTSDQRSKSTRKSSMKKQA